MAFGANANKTMRAISKMVALTSRQKMSALPRMLALPRWPTIQADSIVRALKSRSAEQANRRISRNREGDERGSGNQCDLHSVTVLKPKLTIGFPRRGMSSVSLSATTAKASRRSMSAAMSSPLMFGSASTVHLLTPMRLRASHAAAFSASRLAAWAAGLSLPRIVPPLMSAGTTSLSFPHRHLLGIEGLSPDEITLLLDRSESYVEQNRQADKKQALLRGRTVINLFFENSTRTRTSFELAGKRLGGDVINMSVQASSIKKGETLIDTAMTLTAMHPDVLVVRHPESGAVQLLSEKVDCSVINAGDGSHEHPTQALLDALTIRRRKARLSGLLVAICGDVLHSRVARSNIALLNTMGARVRVVAPRTLLPAEIERLGVEVFHDMRRGLKDVDIVMMLRLQTERMHGSFVPSTREYFHFFGLDYEKLRMAKPDALIMHPGPMNRGVEIGSEVADDIDRSLIRQQVEIVDLAGLCLAPGLVDMRVQLREPGAEHMESIESGGQAAAAGGVTTMVALPNTEPPVDDLSVVEFLARRAREVKLAKIYTYAAATKGLAGRELTEIGLLAANGAVGFTDGVKAIADALV